MRYIKNFSERDEWGLVDDLMIEISSAEMIETEEIQHQIVVNHVMSNAVKSDIFDSIIGYLKQFSGPGVSHVVSESPVENASVYHYHRVNLEKKLSNPAIATIHHDLNDNDRWFRLENFIGCYEQCSALVCLNTTQKKRMIALGMPEENLVVIPHGFNTQLLAPKKDRLIGSDSKLNIGIVSRRYGRRVKGDAYLFELAKRLHPDEFRFTLVGQDRTLTALELRSLGFECAAYDVFPYKMIQSLYEDIDILLMCSLFEGGPANIPEALATRTPVFSTRIGLSTDMIAHGENGVFLSGSPDEDGTLFMSFVENQKKKFIELQGRTRRHQTIAQPWEEIARHHAGLYRSVHKKNMNSLVAVGGDNVR